MRRDRINAIIAVVRENSVEEQDKKIDTAVMNGYITETEANEIRRLLEEMDINCDKVRLIYGVIENYSPEKQEIALQNAVKNNYINYNEKRMIIELLEEKEKKKDPYKAKIEEIKANKMEIMKIALEHILVENSNYVLRTDISEKQKNAVKEALIRLNVHAFTKNEIEILKKLIPQFITEKLTKSYIYEILGFRSDMIETIEKEDDDSR